MNRITLALALGAAFAAGCLVMHFSKPAPVEAAQQQVFEMRTYYTLPGRLPALQARFRNHTTKLFEKHGMKNVGYWVPMDAPKSENTLIYILGHKDRDAAKKSWDAFRNDPDWKTAQKASEADGKIVEKVESVFMSPTDYSKIQ